MSHTKHLLWRFGFGPSVADWPSWQALNREQAWRRLRQQSETTPLIHFDVADSAIKGLLMGVGETARMERNDLDKDDKRQIREKSRENLKSLNSAWLEEMVESPAQLREKMAFFWHGHFASRNFNILYQQQLLAIIRTHALGNFGQLLREVSKSAAMLAFLNNQQNKKAHPNENFAREVMELFTMGRGHYSEKDVQEAARAFTGWGFRLNGEFVFRRWDHDTGEKTVLGQTGKWTGDEVLDILLQQRSTARFIAAKLYRFLVNEAEAPPERVRALGDRFFDAGYDITALLDAIASSDWFYEAGNQGSKIKSPIELWVGMRRSIPMRLDDPQSQLLLQRALGQVLFHPPNVAGWPGGRTWIDASSLMLRMRLPHIVAGNADLDLRPKADDDQQMGQNERVKLGKKLALEADLAQVERLFDKVPEKELTDAIAHFLWQIPGIHPPKAILERFTNRNTRSQTIQSTLLQLMATPEYQVC